MANETTLPATTPPTSNGPPIGNHEITKEVTARALRVLSGDVRPDDLLVIPPDVVDFVAAAEARGGVPMLPEYRQLMIQELALQHYHAGEIVLCRFVPEGVIVLAVGVPDVDVVLESLSPTEQALTKIQYPATLLD